MNDYTMTITDARDELLQLDERLRRHKVIYITRFGRRVMALVEAKYFAALLEGRKP